MLDDIQRLLIFSVKGNRYAVDLQDVAEVMDPPGMYPVPWAPACIKGAINFHGSLVSVLDLACIMDVGSIEQEGNILVLDKKIANLALWVDGVENIVLTDGILEQDQSNNPLVRFLLVMADGEIRMLALEKLLERIEETLRR
jgi:purine-binding chemotaxis protein CheW